MSHAFVREGEEQWLHDVAPTINALVVYLTRENNGIRVYEQEAYLHSRLQKQAHRMSNGLTYAIGPDGKWEVVD